jgi:hypothetical protein
MNLPTEFTSEINPLVILSVKMTHYLIFWLFLILSFSTVISSVYTDEIFSLVFTDECNKRIVYWQSLPQSINKNIR